MMPEDAAPSIQCGMSAVWPHPAADTRSERDAGIEAGDGEAGCGREGAQTFCDERRLPALRLRR
jgi:hypothetical protein